MSIVFNADEILEMAEQIERNGAKFYRRAAEGSAGSGAKDMLLGLAKMEDDHEKTFADMRTKLSAEEKGGTVFDPYDEQAMYLKAMADGHVFNPKLDPSTQLTGEEPLEEILRTAVDLEKDSIIFYLGLKEMVPEVLGKDRVNSIIREEMGHIVMLSEKLADLAQ
jgi:rubrerythrin